MVGSYWKVRGRGDIFQCFFNIVLRSFDTAGSGRMLRSSFCSGLCRLPSAFGMMEAVVCFVQVFVQGFVVFFRRLGCWKRLYASFNFSCRSLFVGTFVGVKSLVLLLAFNIQCFCRHSIAGTQAGCNPEMVIALSLLLICEQYVLDK